jgi:uncharacterized protein (TIGR02246 family)
MIRFVLYLLPCLLALAPAQALAGPAEDAAIVIDKWSATYSANDPEALVKLYAPDAVLLGTRSPIMSVGAAGIAAYFKRLKGSGNKNEIVDRRMIVLSDTAVVGLGFYNFRPGGKERRNPARFTFLVVNRGGQWLIAHHHSSPRVLPEAGGKKK